MIWGTIKGAKSLTGGKGWTGKECVSHQTGVEMSSLIIWSIMIAVACRNLLFFSPALLLSCSVPGTCEEKDHDDERLLIVMQEPGSGIMQSRASFTVRVKPAATTSHREKESKHLFGHHSLLLQA